jgi:hypothetical protein
MPIHHHCYPERGWHERWIPTQKRTKTLYDQETYHSCYRLPNPHRDSCRPTSNHEYETKVWSAALTLFHKSTPTRGCHKKYVLKSKKYHKKIPGMVQERNHITIVKDRHDPYQCPKKSRIWTADLQGGKVYIIALTYLYFYSIHQSWLVTCIYGCSLSSLLQKWAHQVLLIFLFPEKSFRKYIILSIF